MMTYDMIYDMTYIWSIWYFDDLAYLEFDIFGVWDISDKRKPWYAERLKDQGFQ